MRDRDLVGVHDSWQLASSPGGCSGELMTGSYLIASPTASRHMEPPKASVESVEPKTDEAKGNVDGDAVSMLPLLSRNCSWLQIFFVAGS